MPEERLKTLEERYDHDILLIVQDAVQGLNALLDRLDTFARSSAGEIEVPFDTQLDTSALSSNKNNES